ncbi:Dyp-type peroxidase [Sinorhizobium sp. 7-81]|uniref:Dyp-type peroxidase n=1 Tax=Sinorhizobium sp. 8-89 TaxID=3049089 RepID=UPI0024C31C7F|nr:Dyp-type peroxidase [Sinorhizobium sp. 8-89]MDK1494079.1 Dyp-type peroxidase [Sinorhizobium sp. 8-89]
MPKDLDTMLVPLPDPLYSTPYQNGITDPMWPAEFDGAMDIRQIAELLGKLNRSGRLSDDSPPHPGEAELQAAYMSDYAGRIARQNNLTLIRANVLSNDRAELIDILRLLTQFAVEEMERKPSIAHVGVLEHIPASYRVTVTFGFGATLFVDPAGTDRFGLRARKPKYLKQMPRFPGDAAHFDPARTGTDLLIAVCSDHPYVNVATSRFFVELFNRRFREAHAEIAAGRNLLEFVSVEEGFARKDKREFLRFDDGIDNVHMGADDLHRFVYVEETDGEPAWCVNGSYLVYRKIREDMPRWEAMKQAEQEHHIGRHKESGKPLSRQVEGEDGMLPVYPDPADAVDGPLNSHVRKVQPRRSEPDLFGLPDLERRFVRRPYPFFDGFDPATGSVINGLQFVAFMKSIQQQFEHVTNMWQMNPDFPVSGTGIDVMFANEILSVIDGGYYFCPPGLRKPGDYIGAPLFEGLPEW